MIKPQFTYDINKCNYLDRIINSLLIEMYIKEVFIKHFVCFIKVILRKKQEHSTQG